MQKRIIMNENAHKNRKNKTVLIHFKYQFFTSYQQGCLTLWTGFIILPMEQACKRKYYKDRKKFLRDW